MCCQKFFILVLFFYELYISTFLLVVKFCSKGLNMLFEDLQSKIPFLILEETHNLQSIIYIHLTKQKITIYTILSAFFEKVGHMSIYGDF